MKYDEFMAELFETNTIKVTEDDMELIYEFLRVLILQKKFFTCHKKHIVYVYSFMCNQYKKCNRNCNVISRVMQLE